MAKTRNLRPLKDQAAKEIEKRRYDKAAELYLTIFAMEPEADWPQRAGEAFKRAGKNERAVEAWVLAANGYARGGFLLKAIAVNKSILQIDAQHTATQAMLAELYARRDGVPPPRPIAATATVPATATVSVPVPVSDAATVPASAPAPVPEVPISQRPMPAPLRPPSAKPAPLVNAIRETRTDAPIGTMPLRDVLPARRSAQIAVADVTALVAEAEAETSVAPGAYEIVLDDDELDLQSETDFDGLVDDAPAPATLPKIPLFSSLAEAELRLLIDRMILRSLVAGEAVVREGELGGSMFVIVDGEVQVTVGEPARELARLAAGAFFGEVGVLSDDPRSATVTATAATQLLEISRELTWDIARRSPEVLRTIVRFFRDRMLDRLIGASPMFSQLSPDDARALASQFIFLELDVGVAAVNQGERAPGLFFLLCGAAEAIRDGRAIGTLGPGDVFGEISLLLRTPASADVRAKKKCWALELPQARFQEIMMTYPQVLEYVSNLSESRRLQLDAMPSDVKIELL